MTLVLALLLGWALLAPGRAGPSGGPPEPGGPDRVAALQRSAADAGFAVLTRAAPRVAAAEGRHRPVARGRSAAGQPGAVLAAGVRLAVRPPAGTTVPALRATPGAGPPTDRPARAPPAPVAVF